MGAFVGDLYSWDGEAVDDSNRLFENGKVIPLDQRSAFILWDDWRPEASGYSSAVTLNGFKH